MSKSLTFFMLEYKKLNWVREPPNQIAVVYPIVLKYVSSLIWWSRNSTIHILPILQSYCNRVVKWLSLVKHMKVANLKELQLSNIRYWLVVVIFDDLQPWDFTILWKLWIITYSNDRHVLTLLKLNVKKGKTENDLKRIYIWNEVISTTKNW